MDAELEAIALHWQLYFPFDPFEPTLLWVGATRLFRNFFNPSANGEGCCLLTDIDLECCTEVIFDYDGFCSVLPQHLSSFQEILRENAVTTLACLGLSLCSLRVPPPQGEGLAPQVNRINVRFVNYRPTTPITMIKSNQIGKFVSVRGNVVRVSAVSPLVKRMDFSCAKCGEMITKDMPDGRFEPPTHCENSECKSKIFKPDRSSAVTVDFQLIKIQETDDDLTSMDAGRVPRTIEAELAEELVDSVVPGDVVTVAGVVKALNPDSTSGRGGSRQKGRGKETGLSILLLEANAIETGQGNPDPKRVSADNDPATDTKSDIVAQLTNKDLKMIQKVASKPNVFPFLIQSLCPLIFGHELVKAGLLLALTGGTNVNGDSAQQSAVNIRGDIHVIVVGDPGLGKSQMLQATSAVAPRGVYVCGNTTSTSGLTVTLVKDQRGEFSLEAGALVLADRGVCCIDEFDKMTAEHAALLEAMEQQSISIAKAGIVCTLCSRTSILAAANPIGGSYNRCRTLQENLKMGAPLLSRFDLVFILLDNPEERDDLLAQHVVSMHTGRRQGAQSDSQRLRNELRRSAMQSPADVPQRDWDASKPLSERLRSAVANISDPLPPHMLRKYIAYARHYCHPKLSKAACKVLQAFYLKLRKQGSDVDATPITNRQLESMIRLAQARAKLELREIVTEDDARDVVSLLEESLADIYTNEFGVVDLQRSEGMTLGAQKKKLIDRLHVIANQRHNALFTMSELKEEASKIGIPVGPDFHGFIDSLNDQCYFLKKATGYLLQQNAFTSSSQSQYR